jgi:hypothetical protein
MARKKPARPAKKAVKKAKKKAAPKAAARKVVKKTAKKAAKKPAKAAKSKKPAKKVATKAKPAARKVAVKAKPAKKVAAKKVVAKVAAKPAKKAAPASAKAAALPPTKKPNLDRPRKTVADIHGIPSSLGMAGLASAAHSGGEELRDTLKKNNSASPRLTGGDVDANWQNAEAQGDESPGGDNPTPDQDVVDEIGRALGVEYADDEELQGGAEIAERDTHRWELDPSSKDDFEDDE